MTTPDQDSSSSGPSRAEPTSNPLISRWLVPGLLASAVAALLLLLVVQRPGTGPRGTPAPQATPVPGQTSSPTGAASPGPTISAGPGTPGASPSAGSTVGPTAGTSPFPSGPSPSGSAGATPSASPLPPGTSLGYLSTIRDVEARAQRASGGEQPFRQAMTDLLDYANAALRKMPRPVEALDIRGTTGPFVDDTAMAYGLAVAYAATGDRRYASHSRDVIMAWVTTTTRLVNACPSEGSCQTSLIVGRVVPDFVFAADLIRPAGVLDQDDEGRLRSWLRGLILPITSTLPNNWGDTGTFSRAVITDYVGDADGFSRSLEEWRRRIDMVARNGHIPEEVRRGSSGMQYTQEALQYKVAVARVAELRGVDVWSYVGKNGASLRTAVDYLSYFWAQPEEWPWDPGAETPTPGAFWEIAYQQWPEPSWRSIMRSNRPFGVTGHSAIRWTTITNGEPD